MNDLLSSYGTVAAAGSVIVGGGICYLLYDKRYRNLPEKLYNSFLVEEGVKFRPDGVFWKFNDLESQREQLVKRGKAIAKLKKWEPPKLAVSLVKADKYKGDFFEMVRKSFTRSVKNYHRQRRSEELRKQKMKYLNQM